jgi:hypothetical protein
VSSGTSHEGSRATPSAPHGLVIAPLDARFPPRRGTSAFGVDSGASSDLAVATVKLLYV